MQKSESFSDRESTESMVNIIDNTYAKEEFEQIAANATHMNDDQRTELLGLLNYFEERFDGTIGYWDTYPFDFELNTDYKPFNCKC